MLFSQYPEGAMPLLSTCVNMSPSALPGHTDDATEKNDAENA